MPGMGEGGGARCQNLEHLQIVVFLCWNFLEVYTFATTYWKAFIVGPKVPYPTPPHPTPPHPTPPHPTPPSYPTLSYPSILPYPTPTLTLPYPYPPHPNPTHPYPPPTLPLSLPCPAPTPYPTLPYPHQSLLPGPYVRYMSQLCILCVTNLALNL